MTKQLIIGCVVVSLLVAAHAVRGAEKMNEYKVVKDEWFSTDDGRKIIANIISWQNEDGGWSKAYDVSAERTPGVSKGEWAGISTIDNDGTFTETRLCAKAFKLTKNDAARVVAEKGIDFLLKAQYDNGGWPQRYPPPAKNYGRFITYNDNAMVGVMKLMREVARDPLYDFIDKTKREKAQKAFDKGIECILKCQIKVNGQLTGWCQQHDPVTFAPMGGRSYELASISGSEGAAIARMLMELDHPSEEVRKAVEASVAWFEKSKITGIRIDKNRDEKSPEYGLHLVPDANAPAIWARFYDIETNRPFFCDRDGIKKFDVMQIETERRLGYAWYGVQGQAVLDDYVQWCKKWKKI